MHINPSPLTSLPIDKHPSPLSVSDTIQTKRTTKTKPSYLLGDLIFHNLLISLYPFHFYFPFIHYYAYQVMFNPKQPSSSCPTQTHNLITFHKIMDPPDHHHPDELHRWPTLSEVIMKQNKKLHTKPINIITCIDQKLKQLATKLCLFQLNTKQNHNELTHALFHFCFMHSGRIRNQSHRKNIRPNSHNWLAHVL